MSRFDDFSDLFIDTQRDTILITVRSHGGQLVSRGNVRIAFLHWSVRGELVSWHRYHLVQLVVRLRPPTSISQAWIITDPHV